MKKEDEPVDAYKLAVITLLCLNTAITGIILLTNYEYRYGETTNPYINDSGSNEVEVRYNASPQNYIQPSHLGKSLYRQYKSGDIRVQSDYCLESRTVT